VENDLTEKIRLEAEKVGIKLMTNSTLKLLVEKKNAGELSRKDAMKFSDILDEAEEAAVKRVGEVVE